MRRLTAWVGLACGLALLLFFYRSVLFQGGQFGFRDAAHFYYPLYQKVQAEWDAGRWPLWDPAENAGMPLLGNPTAAVLYPGKLIYAALALRLGGPALRGGAHGPGVRGDARPDAVVGDEPGRGRRSPGLAYAFGGPVLFQYCNIIFLVGAAWTPWGFLAVDRWLRLGRPGALAGLAVVLAMQVLGGDPESAYLIGLCAGGYAVGLAWVGPGGPWRVRAAGLGPARGGRGWWPGWRSRWSWPRTCRGSAPSRARSPGGRSPAGSHSGKLPGFRPSAFEGPVPSLPWASLAPDGRGGGLGGGRPGPGRPMAAAGVGEGAALVPKLAGLAAAAVLAGALSAAQTGPGRWSSPGSAAGRPTRGRTTSTRSASSRTGWSSSPGPASSAGGSASRCSWADADPPGPEPPGLGPLALPRRPDDGPGPGGGRVPGRAALARPG